MKKIMNIRYLLLITLVSCQTKVPLFSGENAFGHLKDQCAFGPRNPGSEGHRKALEYYISTFESLADTVIVQSFTETMPRTGAKVLMNNVIAQFNNKASKQIMISAHWDTRPWADRGENDLGRNQPIQGANDGASGVAVIIELASIFDKNPPPFGINLVLFDAEDYGVPGILFIPSIILEILFPLLIIVGYKTKLAALVMALFTFTVAIIFHTDFSEGMQMMLFLKDIAIAGGFMIVIAHGPGKISLDYYFKSKQ